MKELFKIKKNKKKRLKKEKKKKKKLREQGILVDDKSSHKGSEGELREDPDELLN